MRRAALLGSTAVCSMALVFGRVDALGEAAVPVASRVAAFAGPATPTELRATASTAAPVALVAAVGEEVALEAQPAAVDGLLTFRGNATRSWYGTGPIPRVEPSLRWSRQIGCSVSYVGSVGDTWCGTGWTGQPAVVVRSNASPLVVVGGYNRAVNFFDAADGADVHPPYVTGDIIKGSVTVDPDGFPLVYSGSRDGFLHVIALDRAQPTALWKLAANATGPTMWNDDWDASPLVLDDHLIAGGENSRMHVVRLNRGYGDDGLVTIAAEIVSSVPGWDDELVANVGPNVSIENSVAVHEDVAYFANSGGLVQGWDLDDLRAGTATERSFRFWVGDDTDASIVIDADGTMYVAVEYERATARSAELGQIVKLDPARPDDPVVWSIPANSGLDTGVWATPALAEGVLYVPLDDGRLWALDAADGALLWERRLPGPLWSSPVVIDDVLLQADCAGGLHAFDVSEPRSEPTDLWTVDLEGCIESTPAVWDGVIYVGTRAGSFHAIG